MRARPAIVALAAFAVAGCSVPQLPFMRASSPQGSYFTTKLCGVQLGGRDRTVRLHLTLDVAQPLPKGALVETEFHDPEERKLMTTSRVVTGAERSIELVSPPIAQVRARTYETVTRVYAGADRKQILGVHTYLCESLVDQRELPAPFR